MNQTFRNQMIFANVVNAIIEAIIILLLVLFRAPNIAITFITIYSLLFGIYIGLGFLFENIIK